MAKQQSLIRRGAEAFWGQMRNAGEVIFPSGYGAGWGGYRNPYDFTTLFSGLYAGSNINYEQQLGDKSTSHLIMTPINWMADRLPEAEMTVVATDREDNERVLPRHKLVEFLNAPNPNYEPETLWEHYAFSWIMDGNVFWWVIYNGLGEPVEIWPLPHWLVKPRNNKSYVDFWEYTVDGQSIFIPPITSTDDIPLRYGRMIHFRAGTDPYEFRMGCSRLKAVFRQCFTSSQIANFAAALATNSGVPPILVTFKEPPAGFTGEDGLARLRQLQSDIESRVSGDRRGKPMVMTYPLDVKQLSFNPADMDLRALDFKNQEDVAAIIGIPVEVLGFGASSKNSSYNNVEQAQKDAIRRFMVPRWKYRDSALTRQLLPAFGGKPGERVRYDKNSVQSLREDEDALADRIRKDVDSNLLTLHDAQMMRGWKPDPDLKGVYLRKQGVLEVRDGKIVPRPMTDYEHGMVAVQKLNAQANSARSEQQMLGDGKKPAGNAPAKKPAARKPANTKKSLLPMISRGIGSNGVDYLPLEHIPNSFKSPHRFSVVMAPLEGDVARMLSEYSLTIPDEHLSEIEKGRETEFHVTVLYGLHTDAGEEIKPVVGELDYLHMRFGRTNYFSGPGYDVVYVEVLSPTLHQLNGRLRDEFEHTATHAEYHPHATIAYMKPGLGKEYMDDSFLEGCHAIINRVLFRDKESVITEIPVRVPGEAYDPDGETDG